MTCCCVDGFNCASAFDQYYYVRRLLMVLLIYRLDCHATVKLHFLDKTCVKEYYRNHLQFRRLAFKNN